MIRLAITSTIMISSIVNPERSSVRIVIPTCGGAFGKINVFYPGKHPSGGAVRPLDTSRVTLWPSVGPAKLPIVMQRPCPLEGNALNACWTVTYARDSASAIRSRCGKSFQNEKEVRKAVPPDPRKGCKWSSQEMSEMGSVCRFFPCRRLASFPGGGRCRPVGASVGRATTLLSSVSTMSLPAPSVCVSTHSASQHRLKRDFGREKCPETNVVGPMAFGNHIVTPPGPATAASSRASRHQVGWDARLGRLFEVARLWPTAPPPSRYHR